MSRKIYSEHGVRGYNYSGTMLSGRGENIGSAIFECNAHYLRGCIILHPSGFKSAVVSIKGEIQVIGSSFYSINLADMASMELFISLYFELTSAFGTCIKNYVTEKYVCINF